MEEREVKGIKLWKILLLLSVIFFTIAIYFYKTNKPKEIQKEIINNNYSSKTIRNITFEKIKIYKKNNKYYFTAKATNKTKNDIELSKIEIKLDEYKFYTYIGSNLKSNEYKMIFMETNKDISTIKKIEFIVS